MTPLRHIGILGGSFNPVHIGHVMLADYIAQFSEADPVDEVWLMLSPLNPLKTRPEELVPETDRMAMLRLACDMSPRLDACDIELSMPRPSYTIDSLNTLAALYPDCRFSLIIGSDNWAIFDRWRSYREIIMRFPPVIYPRPGYEVDAASLPEGVTMIPDAPVTDISSTMLRRAIAAGKDMTCFLPAGVAEYIRLNNLYSITPSL